jgi:two-component system, LytTR family, sensor kinase
MKQQQHTREYNHFILKMKERPILFDTGLWVIFLFLLSGLTSLNGSWPFSFYLLNMLVALPAMLLFGYTMKIWGNRLLFEQRRPVLFFLVFIVLTLACSLLIPVLHHRLFFGLLYPRVFEPGVWFNWRLIPQNLILLWFPYFILSIQSLFMHWFKAEQEKLIVKNKQLLAEIQLMKIKLHPHFLFNTLNNLYAMACKDNPMTSEYIMRLSELYRVMLYECNKEFYPLLTELSLIEHYIELEKIRYDDRLEVSINFPSAISDEVVIPPLLLFTFVENAFKHGCRNEVGKPFVRIQLEINDDYLFFKAENSTPEQAMKAAEFGGIGLDNTMKRLELIYENEYVLENGRSPGGYSVFLKIPKLMMS